ncbi:Cathepsin B [Halotydeus destructor]|nr:Cathepsin B [Halotydeus destructor]
MAALLVQCACSLLIFSLAGHWALDPVQLDIGPKGNLVVKNLELSPRAITIINSLGTTWRAGESPLLYKSLDQIKGMLGAKLGGPAPVSLEDDDLFGGAGDECDPAGIPETFDCRVKWGATCPSIANVRDQGNCGSCFCIAPATAMTERCCIATGKPAIPVSTTNVLRCCMNCGFQCQGGYPGEVWKWWALTGITSGGFAKGEGCQPYYYGPHGPDMKYDEVKNERCQLKCESKSDDYNSCKTYGKNVKRYKVDEMTQVQCDVMKYGPMTACFEVMSDFPMYKSGVYRPHSADSIGGHCVCLYGWGTENGVKYWLFKNSWGAAWGEQGFFRYQRGQNVGQIESEMERGECDLSRGQYGGKKKGDEKGDKKKGKRQRRKEAKERKRAREDRKRATQEGATSAKGTLSQLLELFRPWTFSIRFAPSD